MQVLHIIRATGLAGAENHLMTLLAGLRASDIDARLLHWVPPDVPADEVVARATALNIPVERQIMPGLFAPRFFWQLVRYLRQQKPDIVHVHLVHAETYAIPAARLAGVPYVVCSSHNDDPFRRRAIFRLRGRALWRLTHKGIAISDAIKDFLIQVEGAQPHQIQRIYYGLPTPTSTQPATDLNLPANALVVGSVCRLTEQKGLRYALQAMATLMPKYPNLHYVLAGTGDLADELQQQARALGIAERVHFLGWRTDAAALMTRFDIFLAPSLWEGFGLVFLEAMGQSCPIISTRVTSIPEVIADGACGILVPPRDSQAIASAIAKLLDNPDLCQKMGASGRKRLETVFSPDAMIQQTLQLYRELANPH